MNDFGAGAVKLWFQNPRHDYPFHSDWSTLPQHPRLIDMAKHPYFLEAFEFPFSTFALEITHLLGVRDFYEKENDFHEYEEQFEELTAWLYEKYAERDVTFILQNWEGDWLFRSSYAAEWSDEMLASLPDKTDRFMRWFAARQRGLEKARNTALAKGSSRCRVMHAVEVNRVLDLRIGQPTLAEHVLPHVPVDLISWSSYDGMGSEVDLWHGVEIIKHQMRSSGFLPEPTVMIGEIGYPENEQSEQWLREFWDRTLGTFFALDVPLILHWELYCNELTELAKQAPKPDSGCYQADECRGFWLYRPDGSLSHVGNIFQKLLMP